jgi:hypothetical protein
MNEGFLLKPRKLESTNTSIVTVITTILLTGPGNFAFLLVLYFVVFINHEIHENGIPRMIILLQHLENEMCNFGRSQRLLNYLASHYFD